MQHVMGLEEVKGALKPMLEELLHKEFAAVRLTWGLQLHEEMQKLNPRCSKRSNSVSGDSLPPRKRGSGASGPGGLIAGAGASARVGMDSTMESCGDGPPTRDESTGAKRRDGASWMVKSLTGDESFSTDAGFSPPGVGPVTEPSLPWPMRRMSPPSGHDAGVVMTTRHSAPELPPRPAAPVPPVAVTPDIVQAWDDHDGGLKAVQREPAEPRAGGKGSQQTSRGRSRQASKGSIGARLDKPDSRSHSKEGRPVWNHAAKTSSGSLVAGKMSSDTLGGECLPHMSVTGTEGSSKENVPLPSTMHAADAQHAFARQTTNCSLEILPHSLPQANVDKCILGPGMVVEGSLPSLATRKDSSGEAGATIRGSFATYSGAARDVMGGRAREDDAEGARLLNGHGVHVTPSSEMKPRVPVSRASSSSSIDPDLKDLGFDPRLMVASTTSQAYSQMSERKQFLGKARVATLHQLLKTSEEYWNLGSDDEAPVTRRMTMRKSLMTIVRSSQFDYFVCLLIILNAVSIGAQTNYVAVNQSLAVPKAMRLLETVFCIMFASELMLRLYVFRTSYFCTGSWQWNLFDVMVVGVQVMEEILAHISPSSDEANEGVMPTNLSFTRILRILRLVRVIRLVRVLRLIRELRMLVSSISNSLKSLGWTVLLLVLLIYTVSLYLTQLVSDYTIGSETYDDSLRVYYGSVGRTMLSLFESITGGLDWDSLVHPLTTEISPYLAFFFSFFIAFSVLAMLNVVTGVFVESVLLSARADKDQFLVNNVREIFQTVDGGIQDGCMNLDQFLSKLHTPQMQEFLKGIDVDPSDAKGLFRLLDVDESGVVEADEFLSGCLRLRGPAKALDAALIIQEVRTLQRSMEVPVYAASSPSPQLENGAVPPRCPTVVTLDEAGSGNGKANARETDLLGAVEEATVEGSCSLRSSPKNAWRSSPHLTPVMPVSPVPVSPRSGVGARSPRFQGAAQAVAANLREVVNKVTPVSSARSTHRPIFSGQDVPLDMGTDYTLERS